MSLDDDAELVRLAYTLVVEPERFNEAVELLRERTDRILMEGGVAAVADFDSIAVHLNNARELMNRRGRRTDRSVGSSKNMQAAAHPVLLVTKDALVCAANDQAVKAFGIRIGSEIPHQCLEASVRQQLSQQLADLSDSSSGLLGVFQAHRIHPVGTTSQLALTMTRQPDGEIVGQLTTLSSYWVPHVGEEFARNLRLTKAELDVTKAIVTGESMEQLASRKQRALGTVRNQKKRLLSKLGLSSQVELACLFSGFAQLHFQPPDTQLTRPFAADLARQHGSISRTSGGILDYDLYGPRDGHPVLFLHSLLGGTGLTELQKKEVQKQGLRLIMPWRPFYGETTDEGLLSDHLERYATDIIRLMDSLGVAVCPVLSVTESAPYAFALAKIAPERFTELQLFGPSLPLADNGGLQGLNPSFRTVNILAKYTPSVLRFYIRSAIAKIDAGFDIEFALDLFEGSAADQATLRQPEMLYLARQATGYAFRQVEKAASPALQVVVSDWQRFLQALEVPVTLHVGESDPKTDQRRLDRFAKKYPWIDVVRQPGCGQLVFYQLGEKAFCVTNLVSQR